MARAAAPMFRGLRARTSTTTRPSSSERTGKRSILRQSSVAEESRDCCSARRRRRRLCQLLALGIGMLGFFAGFQGQISRAKADADLLEEGSRRIATGKDPDKIIGDFL